MAARCVQRLGLDPADVLVVVWWWWRFTLWIFLKGYFTYFFLQQILQPEGSSLCPVSWCSALLRILAWLILLIFCCLKWYAHNIMYTFWVADADRCGDKACILSWYPETDAAPRTVSSMFLGKSIFCENRNEIWVFLFDPRPGLCLVYDALPLRFEGSICSSCHFLPERWACRCEWCECL